MSKETATAVEIKDSKKQITLSDGRVATFGDFKGKHIMQARRLVGNDPDLLVNAMIATVVSIDGKPVFMEDLDEMEGVDVLALMGEFSGFFPAPAK